MDRHRVLRGIHSVKGIGGLGAVIISLLLLHFSCVEPTIVGNDLLSGDLQVVGFTDTFRLRAAVVKEDSILTHSGINGGQIQRHAIGYLDDPFFGKASSVATSQVFVATDVPAFLTRDIDSVVIQLVYLNGGHYGALDQPVSIQVHRIEEELDPTSTYYSNRQIDPVGSPIAVKENFVPNLEDSVLVERPGDTTLLKPHLRIRVDDSFVDEIFAQPDETFEDNDSLQMWLPGLQFDLNGAENTMLAFNFDDLDSGIRIYYSEGDTATFRTFRLLFTSLSVFARTPVQISKFEHDYAGAAVEPFIGDTELTDSLIFLQSLSGVNTEFEIIGLPTTTDIIINQAILELYTADLPGNDLELYPFINRVQTKVLDEEGSLVNSPDIVLAEQFGSLAAFGGTGVETDQGISRYSMNITANVQDILQGRRENKIFLSSYLKQNQPNRLIFYGPGHSTYPARLKLTFTRVTD